MNNATKKCPMCAEEIPLTATICEYCGAQFKMTSTGYCQNCHQVREADGNGQCRVCGSAVMDLHVESKFIKEPVQAPLSASPPKIKKSYLPYGFLMAIVLLGIGGVLLWFGRNTLPAVSSPFTTVAPTITATSTSTSTPTASPTNAPRPTPTVTPLPSWVTSFAEPILAAIANTPPHFEDDFSQASDSWRVDPRDDRCRVKIQDGAFTMSVEAGREMARCPNPGMRMNNFALRVDIDFSGLNSRDSAEITWHGTGYSDGVHLSFERW